MNPFLRLFKNSAALTLTVLLERGVSFVLPWYVARVLGRQDWGLYSTALTFILIAAPLAYWGLDQLLPREVARASDRPGTLLGSGAIVGAVSSLLTSVVGLIVVRWLGYPSPVERLAVLGLALVLFPRTESIVCESIINGLERMEWIALVRFPVTILRVIVSIWLLSRGSGLGVLFAALAGYHLLVLSLYLILFLARVPGFRLGVDWSLARSLGTQAVPFVSAVFIGEAFKHINRIFLSKFQDIDSVGIYTTGIMAIQVIYMVAPAIMTALFPALSRVYAASRQDFSTLVSQLFKLLVVGVFPLALTVIAFADPLIPVVFGPEYDPSVPVLRVTALGIAPSFAARLLYRTMLASNNERLALRVSLVNSVVSLVLNVVLIPRYGVLGASIAAASIEMLGLIQNLGYASTRIVSLDVNRALLRPLFCIVTSVVSYAALMRWSSTAAWAVSIVVFVGVTVLTRTVTRRDWRILSEALGQA